MEKTNYTIIHIVTLSGFNLSVYGSTLIKKKSTKNPKQVLIRKFS